MSSKLNLLAQPIVPFLARSWALVVVLLLVFCDLRMPQLMETSDFVSCIWVGARLFAQHRFAELYAPYSAVSFTNQPCDLAAHQMLPHLPSHLISEFNYCPLVAWLLSPLSWLAPNIALLVWQVLSGAALIAAVKLMSAGHDLPAAGDAPQAQPASGYQSRALIISLLFLPVAISIWIGQLDIVLGVFFYAVGYRLLMRRQEIPAGLAFAVSCLKPQFVIVPGLFCLVYLVRRRLRFAAAFVSGLLLLAAINIAVASPELLHHWLWTVRLCEKVFTDGHTGLAKHLMMGIPGILLLSAPPASYATNKLVIYAVSALLGLLTAYACTLVSNKDEQTGIAYTTAIGIILMPFTIPNFMFYDLSIFVIAAMACLEPAMARHLPRLPASKLSLITLVAVNCYTIVMLINNRLLHPALLLSVIIVIFAKLLGVGLMERGRRFAFGNQAAHSKLDQGI